MTISGYVIRQLINEDLIKKQCREVWGFVWITDFPLFKEAENGLESMHHPFTAPKPEFINSSSGLIEGDPRDASLPIILTACVPLLKQFINVGCCSAL
jgi:aspartyl-tRNA synthetase